MSAETLREAAGRIEDEWQRPTGTAWHRERDFHLAVADWLIEAAEHLEAGEHFATVPDHFGEVCPTALEGADCSVLEQALAVARAYLGGDA